METGNLSEAEDVAERNAGDELSILKQRARMMNLTFSNNIGVEALRLKINAKNAELNETEEPEIPSDVLNPLAGETKETQAIAAKPRTLRQALLEDEMRLIRLRITNMDPKKKELPGEILTIANEYLGTISKFIPFGETTDEGYHVPHCLYTLLKNRKFLNIRVTKGEGGRTKMTHSWANEFALEVLPPLTRSELAKLAAAQSAAGVIAAESESF